MNRKFSALILSTVSACALGIGAASAQTAAPAVPQTAETSGIEEVVVTAERRSETVQNVPMTIQALTGQTLQDLNVTTVDDILKYTPNVTYGNNGPGQGNIFMRGLSAGFAGNQSSATVGNFPNVALYLDDQSMQFPARNVDIFMVDMNRIEILEGPQGTLFGGGAEAGAVRYITNKPIMDEFGGSVELSAGLTNGGGPNGGGNAVLNIPIIDDKLAVRLVVYDDHRGGYIDNVRSTFTRNNEDLGNFYFNIKPTNGLCPNHQPAGAAGFCSPPSAQINNNGIAGSDQNPVDYGGGRLAIAYQINEDWDVLITQSFQNLDAEGLSVEYPTGSDFQALKPLQVTAFTPSYDHDWWTNTAWTVNGRIGDLRAVYTGGYMYRHIDQQMEYTNYSRSVGGQYYECTGGSTGWGNAAPQCYSPAVFWHDSVDSTHLTNEVRVSTPDDWQLRAIGGAFFEQFRIYDVMNFNYKTIPDCDPANLASALAGGPVCIANVTTAPGSTANDPGQRGNSTAFGEDTQRGYDQTAFFASVDYDLLPHELTASIGTRWYDYSEFETGSQYATGTGCLNVPNGQCAGGLVNIDAAHDHKTYTGFKSRGNLTWHITPTTLAYFTYSEGFRPGGFNRSVSAVAPGPGGLKQFEKPNGYAPDSLINREIGFKTELFDHHLLVNLSAYDMDWENVQFLFFNPTELGNTTFGVNGPNYQIQGVEAQFVARPFEGVTIQGSTSYDHDIQTNSPCLLDNIAGTPAFGQCITQINAKGSAGLAPFTNPFGAPGTVPAFSPTWEANLRVRYDWLMGGYNAFAWVGGNYTGPMYNQPATYAPGTGVLIPNTTYLRYLQPGYATADLAVGATHDQYSAELSVSNLFNSHASTFTSSAQFIESEVPIRPQVVTLKVGMKF